MKEAIERWLAARDAPTLRAAWARLGAKKHDVSNIHRKLTAEGASCLAEAMTGERADWVVELSGEPDVSFSGEPEGAFLDHLLDVSWRVKASWRLFERRGGRGGVQVVKAEVGDLIDPREGASFTVVRVFDLEGGRAASVHVDGNTVATVGDVDLAPLDLCTYGISFVVTATYDVATLRGLVAQFATDLDAHYDTSPAWPGGVVSSSVDDGADLIDYAFGDGAWSVGIREKRKPGRDDMVATVHGLPLGHKLEIRIRPQGSWYVYGRLPDAGIDAVRARIAKIGKLID